MATETRRYAYYAGGDYKLNSNDIISHHAGNRQQVLNAAIAEMGAQGWQVESIEDVPVFVRSNQVTGSYELVIRFRR
jgi:hypothetical protein